MQTITVIGGGASGTLLCANLLKSSATQPLHVNLIEKRDKIGRGVAYSTHKETHLLNVPAAKMGAFPDHIEGFHLWLERNGFDYQPSDFVPRMLYGDYLQFVLEESLSAKAADITFEKHRNEVVAIERTENRWQVSLENGAKISSDKVVLAFGNFAPPHPSVGNQAFVESAAYFQNPWSEDVYNYLRRTSSVLIIGTGLSMVDVVLELAANDYRGVIYALSTRGLLPAVHRLGQTYPSFYDEMKDFTRITEMFQTVLRHIEKAAAQNIDWRAVIDSLRPHTSQLWLSLSTAEKRYFLQHLSRYWNIARHRMPPTAATVLESLSEEKRLIVKKGRLKNISPSGAKSLQIDFSREGKVESLTVEAVVNCIGAESNYRRIKTPLVEELLDKRIIECDAVSHGINATTDGRIINAEGRPHDDLFTLGTALKGILWESTAIPEIRTQAANLARKLTNDTTN